MSKESIENKSSQSLVDYRHELPDLSVISKLYSDINIDLSRSFCSHIQTSDFLKGFGADIAKVESLAEVCRNGF